MRTKDFLITAIVLFVSFLGYSAKPPPPPGLPATTPIDSDIWLLVTFGILLAGYKLIIYRKKQKTQSKI